MCRITSYNVCYTKLLRCVGHDSQFFKFSEGLATTLIAKDRVLAHNPIGALNLADSYYSRVWGPEKPEKPPKLPRQGRKA